MTDPAEPDIVITRNGPYLVSVGLPIREQALSVDEQGNTWDLRRVPWRHRAPGVTP